MTTEQQFDKSIEICREIFVKKLSDYGAAWRIMRAQSVTDQIFIKANRIRQIETTGIKKVDEGVFPELIAIVNYAVIGLIQLKLGYSETIDKTSKEAVELYDRCLAEAKNLMFAKNHDYNDAWRMMRPQSYTDLILTKINRTKMIEDHEGATLASEGIDANYFDMLIYAVFGIIQHLEKENKF
ncbi:MAG: DUF1599 domain-containing protein [Prevotellaceae bacterium]|jgi:hypothetical protein|nr:DUF1599 domain-containing protein [Prevotellaceae bacterium]